MKKLTGIFIVILFVIVVGVDVFLWLSGEDGVTISEVYLSWLEGRPWLIAAPAYLLGHLTWPQYRPCKICDKK